MSGIEVAGIVLAVLPLVISALENYRAGKGVASSILKWKGHLDDLILRLKVQKAAFYLHILELLREAGVKEIADKIDLTEDECASILRDAKTGDELKEYLGNLHSTFLEILGHYERCLKTIAAKLGHIKRLPKAPKDDLAAIVDANSLQKTSLEVRKRLSFTIERASLKALVDDLREDRLSLKTIIKGMKTQQAYTLRESSDEAQRLVKTFEQVQASAVSLFSAICKGRTCKCTDRHKVMIRLDSRLEELRRVSNLERKSKHHIAFHLFLPLEDGFLQEALVTARRVHHSNDDFHTRSATAASAPQMAAKNLPIITTTPAQSTFSSPYKPAQITNICQDARQAHARGQILTLELAADVLALMDEPTRSRYSSTAATTLEQFLKDNSHDEDSKMTPKQQTVLSLNIASSILQFRQTYWCGVPWNKRTIKFLVQDTGGPNMEITGPYVEQIIDDVPTKGQENIVAPDPKSVLLELAILLLEIWHNQTLDVWIAKSGMKGPENIESLEARQIAAIRWLEKTSGRLPLHHLTAIEQCLAICSGRLRYWQESTFQRQYCENVIKPLQESTKAW